MELPASVLIFCYIIGAAIGFYILYVIMRKAVAAGMHDYFAGKTKDLDEVDETLFPPKE